MPRISLLLAISFCLIVGLSCTRHSYKSIGPNHLIPEAIVTGFIQVDDKGSDVFYILAPSRAANPRSLLIWFTGGPGCGSTSALIYENGPFLVNEETGKAEINPYAWNSKADIIFVDQPIRTGYSHAEKRDVPISQEAVAAHMVTFLKGFLEVHKHLKNRDLYLVGESYAGHFIPHVGKEFLQHKEFNLKGVAIGNGWISAHSLYLSYNPFAKLHNLHNEQEDKDQLERLFTGCSGMLQSNSIYTSPKSTNFCESLADRIIKDRKGKMKFSYFDVREPCDVEGCIPFDRRLAWLNHPEVQRLFGVDKRYEDFEPDVYKILIRLDWRRDSAEALTPLLNAGTKVLAYYGEYDWICNWISGDYMAGNLTWAYQSEFNHQPKRNITIGMSKKYKNFELLTIFGAGHMVPMDQPEVALDMLHNFIGETN